jgi:hypothetical protein
MNDLELRQLVSPLSGGCEADLYGRDEGAKPPLLYVWPYG